MCDALQDENLFGDETMYGHISPIIPKSAIHHTQSPLVHDPISQQIENEKSHES